MNSSANYVIIEPPALSFTTLTIPSLYVHRSVIMPISKKDQYCYFTAISSIITFEIGIILFTVE